MENICLVIDLDGYCVGQDKKFYCRELGYADLSTPFKDYKSFRFDLRPVAQLLIPKDQATVRFIEKKLGVLKLWPDHNEIREGKLYPLADLEKIVIDLWEKYRRSNKAVVAYKGGHIEKDLLEELNIPHVNLETFGCPKYDSLPHDAMDCGFHSHVQGPVHCPMKECAAFAEWIRSHVKPAKDWWADCWWNISEEDWWDIDEDSCSEKDSQSINPSEESSTKPAKDWWADCWWNIAEEDWWDIDEDSCSEKDSQSINP